MTYTRNILLLLFAIACCLPINAKTVRVLFLGNSYIYSNNLPQLIERMANSNGDTLIYSHNTIGGYTLRQHSIDATSVNLIRNGSWDYVVLQEQSQIPSFPEPQVADMSYPYARKLDSIIQATNSCATTLFFMTWGRENGDESNCPNFPPLCTYLGMDSLLQLRYTIMARTNNAAISPVAKVWRHIRTNFPEISLYTADGSHPNINGSYLAAATFYAVMFKKNPQLCNFNSSLTANVATIIKDAAKSVVFDSLDHHFRFTQKTTANFEMEILNNKINCRNLSTKSDSFLWNFGDGNTSVAPNPIHTYLSTGNFEVKLVASNISCNTSDSTVKTAAIIHIDTSGTTDSNSNNYLVFPNPSRGIFTIKPSSEIKFIRVFNALGVEVPFATTPTDSGHMVDLTHAANGMYIVEVVLNNYNRFICKYVKT